MKKFVLIIFIAIAILAVAGWYFLNTAKAPVGANTPAPTSKDNLIRVSSPVSNQIIASPLAITGEARGTWYFEASFPVRIEDANGNVLGRIPAQAQGEWMTENFVPFKAALVFSESRTETGTLILSKDNPSGLPEHDDSISIPVKFK